MKIDWKKRCAEMRREHDKKMKALADEFTYLNLVAYDLVNMDFGSARMRCRIHLSKMASMLGCEFVDYFKTGAWK